MNLQADRSIVGINWGSTNFRAGRRTVMIWRNRGEGS